jgi:KaiC/GvpD/RAD55 family RecA-like ATPase
MNLRNAALEQRLVLDALNNRSLKTRRIVLANTTPEMFGFMEAQEARKLMHLELQRGRDLPRAKIFAETPALSKNARKIVKATKKKRDKARRRKRKEVVRDIEELKRFRRVRAAHEGLLEGGQVLKDKAGPEEIERFCTILENTLAEVRQEFDHQPMVHYGRGQKKEQAREMYRRLTSSAKHRFVSTGIDAIDRHLGGHARGNLVVISAPRKGGKSTMALNMAINQFLRHHLNVLFVSLEMPLEDVEQRIAAKEGNLPFGLVRNPDNLSSFQKKKIEMFCKDLFRTGRKNGARFTIWPVTDAKFTPEALYSAVQGMHYDVIYVDYLTLFHKQRKDLWEMQMEYSRLLKQYAKRLNCVMVTLTQVNANESVKYGTSVEENLDTWFRWPWREDEEAETGEVDLKLALCRHAPTATFPSQFALDKMTINVGFPNSGGRDEESSDKKGKKKKKSGRKERMSANDKEWRKRLSKGDC